MFNRLPEKNSYFLSKFTFKTDDDNISYEGNLQFICFLIEMNLDYFFNSRRIN